MKVFQEIFGKDTATTLVVVGLVLALASVLFVHGAARYVQAVQGEEGPLRVTNTSALPALVAKIGELTGATELKPAGLIGEEELSSGPEQKDLL